jgi:hypothetical protein
MRGATTAGMRSVAQGLPLVVGLGVASAPGVARADEFSLHVLLNGQSGVTSNAFNAPPGGEGASDASLTYQVRPGVLWTYHSHRSTHELSAEVGVDGYDFTDNLTVTAHGAWHASYSISQRSELEGGLGVNAGRVNALATVFSSAPPGSGGVLPTGQVDFYSVDGSQTIGYELTPLWTVRQESFARYLVTDADMTDTVGYEAGLGFNVDRAFKYTAVGARVRGAFQRLGTTIDPLPTVNQDQLQGQATLRVRRDFSENWAGAVEGGVDVLYPLEEGQETHYQPIGSLEVGYFPQWGTATLSVRHSVAPNLFLAQNEITDSAAINATMPLPWLARSRFDPKLTALGSIAAGHTRFLDLSDGSDRASFNIVSADLAVQYTPEENLIYALRYQVANQSDADTDSTDPMLATLGYVRHAVLFTFSGRWPGRTAAEFPARNNIQVNGLDAVGNASGSVIRGAGE